MTETTAKAGAETGCGVHFPEGSGVLLDNSMSPRKSPTTSRDDREAQISARAYLIWIEDGQPEGRQQEHWLRAEKEIDEMLKAREKSTKRRS